MTVEIVNDFIAEAQRLWPGSEVKSIKFGDGTMLISKCKVQIGLLSLDASLTVQNFDDTTTIFAKSAKGQGANIVINHEELRNVLRAMPEELLFHVAREIQQRRKNAASSAH